MIKVKNLAMMTNEISLRNKPAAPGSFKINPRITRKVGKIKDNQFFCEFFLYIGDTDKEKIPFSLNIIFRGLFELEGYESDEEAINFIKTEGVKAMFPYLRAMVTNITSASLMQPIILPVVDTNTMFNEEKQMAS